MQVGWETEWVQKEEVEGEGQSWVRGNWSWKKGVKRDERFWGRFCGRSVGLEKWNYVFG